MNKEETYIDFIIAPYCLGKLLLALDSCNISIFYITLVDNDLMVRIPKSHLNKVIYHIKSKEEINALPTQKEGQGQ